MDANKALSLSDITSGKRYKARPGTSYVIRGDNARGGDQVVATILEPTDSVCAAFDRVVGESRRAAQRQQRLEARILQLERKYLDAAAARAEEIEGEIEELQGLLQEIDIMNPDSRYYHVRALKRTVATFAIFEPAGGLTEEEGGWNVGVMNRMKADFLSLVNWTSD